MLTRPILLLSALLTTGTVAATDVPGRLAGDVRAGYFENTRIGHDDTRATTGDYRTRLRLGMTQQLGTEWRVRGRIAGRYSSEQGGHRLYLRGYAPTGTGLASGETTVDELYVDYTPRGAPWALRAGRFQTQFALTGVASKGLDRNDSPNVDVTWTDGLHYRHQIDAQWRAHLVLEHNHRKGPGSAVRAPLNFSESASRVTTFAGVEATQALGPIVQRMIGVTWTRDALATEGADNEERQDYLTYTARGAASWPLTDAGMRLVPGAEVGYAPNRPRKAVVDSGDEGTARGLAWQAALSLYDIAPGHNLGVVYARIGGGWLLSGDFRGNDELAEIRYQWRFSTQWSFEGRYRIREEIRTPAAAGQPREDRDFYLRVTGRF